jgi:hypothetical protein
MFIGPYAPRSGLLRPRRWLRNSTSTIAVGVDTRGDGGYAILWQPEEFADRLEAGSPIAMWPDWLRPPEPARPAHVRAMAGTRVANRLDVERLIGRVARSVKGERNAILFWANCRLAEKRFPRPEDRDAAIDAMLAAAIDIGLEERQSIRTIESALATIARAQAAEGR